MKQESRIKLKRFYPTILDNIRIQELNSTGNLDQEVENRLRSEIYFLRALLNLEAWLIFKNIPIITEDAEDPSKISNVNPEGAVLAHIVNDLEYAWNNLPETQNEVGRPTKYAAMGLAAKAYMQELDFEKAKPLLENIINSGKNVLMPNFMDNFRIATNNNTESIFEIQASVNDGSNSSMNAEMGIGLNYPYPGEMGLCCGFHQPSQNLVNAYKVDENGLPMFETFNDDNLKNDQHIESTEEFIPFDDEIDPRLDWTVSRRGIPYRDWGINPGRRWIRDQPFGGPYQPASKPIYNKNQRRTLSTATGWMSGINANNYRYFRFSHVLLWRAEIAAYEGDLELARNYVNMIRERASNEVVMGKVLIYRFPSTTYPWGEGTTDADYLTGGDVDWTQPTIIFAPRGTLFTPYLRRYGEAPNCFLGSTVDPEWLGQGLRMLKSVWQMDNTHVAVIHNDEMKVEKLEPIGTTLHHIPLNRFPEAYHATKGSKEAEAIAHEYMRKAKMMLEPSEQDIVEAARTYVANRHIMDEFGCHAVTMDCLGLIGDKITPPPCMAYYQLLNEKTCGCCERDITGTLTLMLSSYLFDKPGFLHNPVPDNTTQNYGGAHCVSPTLLDGFDGDEDPLVLRTHHESDWGVATQVILRENQPATVMKFSSPNTLWAATGTILGNVDTQPHDGVGGSRTGFSMVMDDVNEVSDIRGHHNVLVYGKHIPQLRSWGKLAGIKTEHITGGSL